MIKYTLHHIPIIPNFPSFSFQQKPYRPRSNKKKSDRRMVIMDVGGIDSSLHDPDDSPGIRDLHSAFISPIGFSPESLPPEGSQKVKRGISFLSRIRGDKSSSANGDGDGLARDKRAVTTVDERLSLFADKNRKSMMETAQKGEDMQGSKIIHDAHGDATDGETRGPDGDEGPLAGLTGNLQRWFDAVDRTDVKDIKDLLKEGADVNATDQVLN